MKRRSRLCIAAASAGTLWLSCANAADSGFYIGLGAGRASVQDQPVNPNGTGTINFDADSPAYKLFGGYRLKAIPILDFAAEAAYVNFNKPSGATGTSVEYRMQGGTAAGLVILPLGPVDFFGKGGAVYSSVDKNIGGTTSSKTGSGAVVGAGIGLRLGNFGIRAEYEYFDLSGVNRLQMYSISGVIQF